MWLLRLGHRNAGYSRESSMQCRRGTLMPTRDDKIGSVQLPTSRGWDSQRVEPITNARPGSTKVFRTIRSTEYMTIAISRNVDMLSRARTKLRTLRQTTTVITAADRK